MAGSFEINKRFPHTAMSQATLRTQSQLFCLNYLLYTQDLVILFVTKLSGINCLGVADIFSLLVLYMVLSSPQTYFRFRIFSLSPPAIYIALFTVESEIFPHVDRVLYCRNRDKSHKVINM